MPPRRLVHRLPPRPLLRLELMALPHLEVAQLPLELEVALEPLGGETAVGLGRADRAARLARVGAVREAARGGERLHVLEGTLEASLRRPQLDLPQPRRVDDEPALGQHDELAVRGRVAAAVVVRADARRGKALLAEEPVDERRLADARRAEERHRPPHAEVRAHGGEALAAQRGDDMDGHARGDRLGLAPPGLDVLGEVGLVQADDRVRPALPREHERALEPARVEVAVEPAHEERRVHVGGEDLLLRDAPRDLPREAGAAGQDGVNDGAAVSGRERSGHPVADGREVLRPRGLVPEPARDLGEPLAALVIDAVDAGVRGRYPRGTKTFTGERTKRLLERGGEAETLEIHGERSPWTDDTLVEAHARRVSRSSGEDGDPDCGKRTQQPFFGPGWGPGTECSTDAGVSSAGGTPP